MPMMPPRKIAPGVRRGPAPKAGPMSAGLNAPPATGMPRMGIPSPGEMSTPNRMRMAPETVGTSSPTPMKKGGVAKKGNNNPAKTPTMKKGGMAKPGKGKGMAVVIMIGKGKKGK